MKVYSDRNECNIIHNAACETCFAQRVELKEFDLGGCVLEVTETDNIDDIFIFMKDRDGENKEMHITKDNWAEAYDGWMLFYEKQVAMNKVKTQ